MDAIAGQTATAEEIAAMTPAQYQAYESQQALQTALQNYLAAQGEVSPDSIVDPAQMDPFTAAALGLQAAQIGEPQTVDAPDPDSLDDISIVIVVELGTVATIKFLSLKSLAEKLELVIAEKLSNKIISPLVIL